MLLGNHKNKYKEMETRCHECRWVFTVPHYIFVGENTSEASVQCPLCDHEFVVRRKIVRHESYKKLMETGFTYEEITDEDYMCEYLNEFSHFSQSTIEKMEEKWRAVGRKISEYRDKTDQLKADLLTHLSILEDIKE